MIAAERFKSFFRFDGCMCSKRHLMMNVGVTGCMVNKDSTTRVLELWVLFSVRVGESTLS